MLGEDSTINRTFLRKSTNLLLGLSESRGKEAAGLAVKVPGEIIIYKLPVTASKLIKSRGYQDLLDLASSKNRKTKHKTQPPVTIIGHSRLATDGRQDFNWNNQPVNKDGSVGIHNGIIVNDEHLWSLFPSLKKKYEVDTEILLSLLQYFLKQTGSLNQAVQHAFKYIEGSVSAAVLFENTNSLLILTNTGSLYYCADRLTNYFIFASEKFILKQFLKNRLVQSQINNNNIKQIKPYQGAIIDVSTLNMQRIHINRSIEPAKAHQHEKPLLKKPSEIRDLSPKTKPVNLQQYPKDYILNAGTRDSMMKSWEDLYYSANLKRCSKCVLPATMPFIEFDEDGVCNYCRTQQRFKAKGRKALEAYINKHKSKHGEPDCIVPFSGGRDSTFALHYVKNVLKMNPIAYTYDWGVLTDLGRRNQARICGKLGVEHIIISADIEKKRQYVKNNLMAWQNRPDLGMIPILMAGDKQLLYYAFKMTQMTGIKLVIFAGAGILENALFKIGFAGVQADAYISQQHMPLKDKIKAALYYGKNYISNPRYINSSLLDTLFAFYSNFVPLEHYLMFYDYIAWNEQTILSTIMDEYNWEIEPDTKATWRIDDGTTPFYNYIYMTVAGLTEHDTFRSSQIRQDMISRDEALGLVKEENKPRFESIEWYSRTIGFDCNRSIRTINAIPKLYEV